MSRSADIVSRLLPCIAGFEGIALASKSRIVECKDGRSFTVESRKLQSESVQIDDEDWTLAFDGVHKAIVLKRWGETPAQAKANAKIKASAKSSAADAASGELPA